MSGRTLGQLFMGGGGMSLVLCLLLQENRMRRCVSGTAMLAWIILLTRASGIGIISTTKVIPEGGAVRPPQRIRRTFHHLQASRVLDFFNCCQAVFQAAGWLVALCMPRTRYLGVSVFFPQFWLGFPLNRFLQELHARRCHKPAVRPACLAAPRGWFATLFGLKMHASSINPSAPVATPRIALCVPAPTFPSSQCFRLQGWPTSVVV